MPADKIDLEKLALEAGFRVFGNKIVAADHASSGDASVCVPQLIRIVMQECAQIAKDAHESAFPISAWIAIQERMP